MKTRKTTGIPSRRKFEGDWDQILYCYDKLLYWFYLRRDRSKASKFCRTLEPLLRRVANKHTAIKGEECWSLLYEVRGDLSKAILHRKNEIRLIKGFQKLNSGLEDYGPDDLADRLVLLAILHKESGDARAAVQTLQEAKRICRRNQIPFDSRDLLKEYQGDFRGSTQSKLVPGKTGTVCR